MPRTLSDFAIAVINGNYVLDAGMSPADDSLVLEDGEDNPYSNMLVVRTEDAENEALVTLDELLHSDDVRQYLGRTSEAGAWPASGPSCRLSPRLSGWTFPYSGS